MTRAVEVCQAATACAVLVLSLLAGCAMLLPPATPQPTYYGLEAAAPEGSAVARVPAGTGAPLLTLEVERPTAAASYDTNRIVYLRSHFEPEYFAYSRWVDTPARMLSPLLISAVAASGAFGAVISAPNAATSDLWLGTEILLLQQVFGGRQSSVQFILRANFVDSATRRVLVSRELSATVASASEDPHGGVVAANAAVRAVLDELVGLCGEAIAARNGAVPHNAARTATHPAAR